MTEFLKGRLLVIFTWEYTQASAFFFISSSPYWSHFSFHTTDFDWPVHIYIIGNMQGWLHWGFLFWTRRELYDFCFTSIHKYHNPYKYRSEANLFSSSHAFVGWFLSKAGSVLFMIFSTLSSLSSTRTKPAILRKAEMKAAGAAARNEVLTRKAVRSTLISRISSSRSAPTNLRRCPESSASTLSLLPELELQ